MTMRDEVDRTIAELGAVDRPADAGLVELARQYADDIDMWSATSPMAKTDVLVKLGPKLNTTLAHLHARAGIKAPTAKPTAGPTTIEDQMAKARQKRQQRSAAGA